MKYSYLLDFIIFISLTVKLSFIYTEVVFYSILIDSDYGNKVSPPPPPQKRTVPKLNQSLSG